mgnify:CR=1 FL=1|jgi:23S rRNA (adenine2503-C2)-methyltransferase
MLKIIKKTGDDKFANVYVARTKANKYIEFVESIQPPLKREEKWVLIISTLFGCPVGCLMCDAGGSFQGKLSKEEMLAQIDHMVSARFPNKNIPCAKFKIQFARMGEPAFNMAVLDVLNELPDQYKCPGLLPSLSTIAPVGCESFFDRLLEIKNKLYVGGKFQMQFSLHTTDQQLRDKIIPIKKWNFEQIANYGKKFYSSGDRKITLNFALAQNSPVHPNELKKYFDPKIFIIKITPVNPTNSSKKNNIKSYFTTGAPEEDTGKLVRQLHNAEYEVLVSVGELEENKIGSNCGQYLQKIV